MKPKRWQPGDGDTIAWLILTAGAISVVFYALIMSFAFGRDRYEENAAPECQQEIYELFIDGQLIELPEMDAAECEITAELLNPQTRPFANIECKRRFVCRQEL